MASAPSSSRRTPMVALMIGSPRAMRWRASWLRAKIGSSPGRSALKRKGGTAKSYSTLANSLLEIDVDADQLHQPQGIRRANHAGAQTVVERHGRGATGYARRLGDLFLEVHLVELGVELGGQVEKSCIVRGDGAHGAALEEVTQPGARA